MHLTRSWAGVRVHLETIYDAEWKYIWLSVCIGTVWSPWQRCVNRASEGLRKAQRAYGYTPEETEQHRAAQLSTHTGNTHEI